MTEFYYAIKNTSINKITRKKNKKAEICKKCVGLKNIILSKVRNTQLWTDLI